MKLIAVLLVFAGLTIGALPGGSSDSGSQESSAVSVTREDGGQMKYEFSGKVFLNGHSTLHREWIAVHDPSMPVELVGTPGIGLGPDLSAISTRDGIASVERAASTIVYEAKFSVQAKERLAALEIRFLTFDVWGESGPTLSSRSVSDIEPGLLSDFVQWSTDSRNEAGEFHSSIAYVARVRTMDGRIRVSNPEPVLAEARKIRAGIRPEDLEPRTDKR